ncbi:flagellar protein FlaG [Thermatribacter velox]|uniref:Flagellar protein FlaG n=1 Tax=Thermatribacter velox TaxID=3039681 RepID=A0ABZ2YAG1_9BACT
MRVNPPGEQAIAQNRLIDTQDVLDKASSLEKTQVALEVAFLQKKNQEASVEKVDFNKLQEIIDALNQFMRTLDIELRFQIHEPTHEVIARLINKETGEVIREIPPEKFLDMLAKLQELAGLFVDELR